MKKTEEKDDTKKPIKELFNRILMKIGIMDFGLRTDKMEKFKQVLNSITQDVEDLREMLIQTGQYDQNYICLNCFIKKHNLASGVYNIPGFLKQKDKKCSQCGKLQVCRLDLEV